MPAVRRASYADAMRAWFAGEFETCLALCEAIPRRDLETRSEAALLRARALLRLGRPGAAREAVLAAFVAHRGLDRSLTAQQLLGSAEVRLGDVDAGLARLDAAAEGASREGAHVAVRSEIALQRGLAFYVRRDLDGALAALAAVEPGTDIIAARAAEYRGWTHCARGDFAEAIVAFASVLRLLDECRHRDRHLEATALQQLSHLAAERLDRELWSFVLERAHRLDWSADGLASPRFWITLNATLVEEVDGDIIGALRGAERAEELSPTPALRALATCRRAAIARAAGETFGPYLILEKARAAFGALEPDELRGDDRGVALALAEETAAFGDVDGARSLFARYDGLRPERTHSAGGDPRQTAYEQLVAGAIAEAAASVDVAVAAYSAALRGFRAAGYQLRAAIAGAALVRLGAEGDGREAVQEAARGAARLSWLGLEAAALEREAAAPAWPKLTPVQAEVLALLAAGHANHEIASRRGRSEQTIKNTVCRLIDLFGARSRGDLISRCMRAGYRR
jgi:DNA-binding NarL/FixJ family response regulator